jgi:hypothetical protein
VLAAGQWAAGSMRVAAAAVAAATVGLVYLLACEVAPERRRVALMAAGVFALSPLTIFQAGTFLPYLFQLATGLSFAVALLAGVRIPYRTVGDEVQLILPGQGYELLASEGRRHWIPRNVDDRLAETPPA